MMPTYQRYLEAKKVIDDRSLNALVMSSLKKALPRRRLRAVELGAGIGTMVVRCLERGLVREGDFTVIDSERNNIEHARRYLLDWAGDNGVEAIDRGADSVVLRNSSRDLLVHLVCSDVTDSRTLEGLIACDLLIAHLFLDLVDVRKNLTRFLNVLRPGGVFYFSHMYDGLTTILPTMEHDQFLLRLYDKCMDEREDERSAYPRSHTGREVLQLLLDMEEVEILEAGSSDWVVFPRRKGYTVDERDFLFHMIGILEDALHSSDSIDNHLLEEWIGIRKRQIDEGELTLITHQLDVVGKYYG